MEWINNPWVVGIGGGALSGLLVTFASRALLSRRDRREYVQKLLSANREVIYALRPGISEGHIPDRRVIDALINATARKYAVDQGDLYGPTQVGEELTKEIMDSSFISASTKQEYCNQLESLALLPPTPRELAEGVAEPRPSPRSDLAVYRSRMVTMMSGMLGVMTALMTVVFVFSDVFESGSLGSKAESLKFLLPGVVALSTTVVAATLTLFRSELNRMARQRGEQRKASDELKAKTDADDTT